MVDIVFTINDEARKTIRQIIREELLNERVVKQRIQCASVNCARPGKTENKVQGRLDLSYGDKGPAIWVEVYLCDTCMEFVREGRSVPKGDIPTIKNAAIVDRDDIAIAAGCPCQRCTERRKQTREFWRDKLCSDVK